MRRAMPISSVFQDMERHHELAENPVRQVFTNHKIELVIMVLHLGFSAACWYSLFVWMPTYLQSEEMRGDKDIIENSFLISIIAMFIMFFTMILSAILG